MTGASNRDGEYLTNVEQSSDLCMTNGGNMKPTRPLVSALCMVGKWNNRSSNRIGAGLPRDMALGSGGNLAAAAVISVSII